MRRDLKTCDCGEPTDRFSGQCAMCETDEGLFEQLTTNMPEGQKQALLAMDDPVPVQQVSVPASAFASRAITHYEAALLAALPSGSSGEVFNQWNEARRVLAAAPAAPAADAGLVEALGYQVLFDAIAAATSVYANGAINISVQAFRDALAANRAKGLPSAKS